MYSESCLYYALFIYSLTEDKFLGNMDKEQLNALPHWQNDVQYCTCSYEDLKGNDPTDNNCTKDTFVSCARKDKLLSKENCQIRSKRSTVKPFSYHIIQNNQFSNIEKVIIL